MAATKAQGLKGVGDPRVHSADAQLATTQLKAQTRELRAMSSLWGAGGVRMIPNESEMGQNGSEVTGMGQSISFANWP